MRTCLECVAEGDEGTAQPVHQQRKKKNKPADSSLELSWLVYEGSRVPEWTDSLN